jgi:hypothetical protein
MENCFPVSLLLLPYRMRKAATLLSLPKQKRLLAQHCHATCVKIYTHHSCCIEAARY